MHPLQIITGGLSNLIVLALLGVDLYLFREWYQYREAIYEQQYAQKCLIAALVILAFFTLGRFLFSFILGKKASDEPHQLSSKEMVNLPRPEGHTLYVEFYGPKGAPPLILIHGWSSDSTQWYYFKKHLSQSYRLILLDLPGLGKSGKPQNRDYSLDKFARDLDAVIDLAGSQKPILLGHSIGGMTILTYCKLFSSKLKERIAGLVLVHTTYTNPVRTSMLSGLLTRLQKPVLTPMAHLMIAFAPLLQIMNYINYCNGFQHINNHMMGFGGTESRGQLNLASLLTTISPVAVVARGVLAMFDYDATAVLPTIPIPVLVIAANKDKLTKKQASEFMARLIPGAELVTLQPCGHMGPTERHAEMISAVDIFSKKLLARSAFEQPDIAQPDIAQPKEG